MVLRRSGKSTSPSSQVECLVLKSVFFQLLESIVLDLSSHSPVLVVQLVFYFPPFLLPFPCPHSPDGCRQHGPGAHHCAMTSPQSSNWPSHSPSSGSSGAGWGTFQGRDFICSSGLMFNTRQNPQHWISVSGLATAERDDSGTRGCTTTTISPMEGRVWDLQQLSWAQPGPSLIPDLCQALLCAFQRLGELERLLCTSTGWQLCAQTCWAASPVSDGVVRDLKKSHYSVFASLPEINQGMLT